MYKATEFASVYKSIYLSNNLVYFCHHQSSATVIIQNKFKSQMLDTNINVKFRIAYYCITE